MVIIVTFWLIGILILCGLLYGLHRWLLSLERQGYIYYREKPRGGSSGALFELDKLTRPSVEHVVKAMDVEAETQEHKGE